MNLDNITQQAGLKYVFIENGIAVKHSITIGSFIAATAIIGSCRECFDIYIVRSGAALSSFNGNKPMSYKSFKNFTKLSIFDTHIFKA